MALYYASLTNWNSFLQSLIKDYPVFGLSSEDINLLWQKLDFETASSAVINKYRALQPLKGFLFPVKEEVTNEPEDRKFVILGAKQCDIAHLSTMDNIFFGGVLIDPYYGIKRQNMIIISGDCDSVLPSCFCTLMGGKPYPEKGFDLNLSPVGSGFIVETGSDSGEALVSGRKQLFEAPREDHLKERASLREKLTAMVSEINKQFSWHDPKKIVDGHFLSQVWKDGIAATCVECDACRFSCGTCYCFLLAETGKLWEKMRTWDSCQSTGYGRVAGGANPRKTRTERLRNWYMCKLSYRPENFGNYACTGCGRCINVCQGKIDIRKSLQKLYDEKKD